MKKLTLWILALVALGLAGCDVPRAKRTELAVTPETQSGDRFTITRAAEFSDSFAYSGRRAIYVIRDTKTGAEYFGISGIGISEIGSHRSGKTTIRDER